MFIIIIFLSEMISIFRTEFNLIIILLSLQTQIEVFTRHTNPTMGLSHIEKLIPGARWLRGYTAQCFVSDLIAGVTVG